MAANNKMKGLLKGLRNSSPTTDKSELPKPSRPGSLEKYPGIRASEDDPKKSVHRKRPKDAAAGNETSRRNRSTRVEQRVSVVLHVQVLKGRYQRGSLMLAKY
ncbi:hypothetical protein V6N12_014181 [Hibiscus sabdariffa]|uniref:Uncharacterized protein n=1 Tax=Hibiscus sabdariffa TaxID=183260 RepID=A0ABR2DKI9_9ROSI